MRTLLFILLFFPIQAMSQPTLDAKIAQMLIVGFNGQDLSEENSVSKDISELGIGGVILFDENADTSKPEIVKNIKNKEQLKSLINDLQSITKIPLFVSIDQEGGKVSRLDGDFNVSKLSAYQLGQLNNEVITYKEARKTAKELSRLGININFAPCVDLNIEPKSVIAKKDRMYSKDPSTVSKHALAVIKAHKEMNIMPVIKHFPGHGSAIGDTHEGFVDVTKTFSKKELEPYKTITAKNKDIGVMTTHVFNENIDNKYPLSLSKKSITDLLRKDIGFNGLVFSDDLNMGALNNHYKWEEILINTINAGTDILVIGNNIKYNPDIAKQSIDIIKNAVEQGKISQARIDNAYNKIIFFKTIYIPYFNEVHEAIIKKEQEAAESKN